MGKPKSQLDREIKQALTPIILVREGKMGKVHWKEYQVVTDGRVAIVDMDPALLGGWRFKSVTVQGTADWPKMSRDQIVAYKKHNDDGKTSIATDLTAEFRDKLLDKAEAGAWRRPADG